MELRPLGRSGLRIAPIVFGGNVLGWTADEPTSFALLDAFVAAGFNAIDTADMYSTWVPGHQGGESETVIGRWLKKRGRRDDVVIATKAGMEMPGGRKGLSKAHLLRSVDESLARLQTDYIDLYQSHIDDAGTPVEETMEAHAQLVKAGKVRVVGASNFGAERLAASLAASGAHGWPRYESLQPLYNLADRAGFEKDLAPLCARESLGVLPYFSLASGFLTGKYRKEADLEGKARGGFVKGYLNERGLRILAALDAVAARTGATPAQIALAWLIARPGITGAIASATSVAQLNEILGAVRLSLSAADVAALDAASA